MMTGSLKTPLKSMEDCLPYQASELLCFETPRIGDLAVDRTRVVWIKAAVIFLRSPLKREDPWETNFRKKIDDKY